VATIEQVYALTDAIEPRFRALVLTATFTGLRLGELRALRRSNLDLLHATVRVVEQLQELADGTLVLGPPKTDAGVRTVAIPKVLIPELEAHLAEYSGPGADGLVFASQTGVGTMLRRPVVVRVVLPPETTVAAYWTRGGDMLIRMSSIASRSMIHARTSDV